MFVLASTALVVLAAAPAPAASASGFRLIEGIPAGFKVDGKLDEWKQPVSVTLDATNQVAGKSKVSSPQDLSARIWVAVGPEGIAMAGEVKDDKFQLPTNPAAVNSDHVELTLTLPQPQMPSLAFVNQFGEHEVPTVAACENNEEISEGEPEDCRKWWKTQTARRKLLLRAFSAQYGLMDGYVISYEGMGTVGVSHYEPTPDGYRFEALIPPNAFPRSAEAPLRNLRVIVDLVDKDEGAALLETFLSSSKERKFRDPSTYHAVTLKQPLRFGEWPELIERALKANPSSSYQPGAELDKLEVWINPARGYQYKPEEDSPKVVELSLWKEDPLSEVGDVELVSVPMGADWTGGEEPWLISRRGKTILDAQKSGTKDLRVVRGSPGLRILQTHEGTMTALGTGACGACPVLSFRYVTMDAQGRFSEAEELEGAFSEGEEVEAQVSPDLSKIEAYVIPDEKAPRQLVMRYTWNAKTGHYDQQKFERPAPKE